MFGPRLSRIFASRWMAVWWSAIVLLTAWQLVPDPDDAPDPGPATETGVKLSARGAAADHPWDLASTAPGHGEPGVP